MVNLSKHLMGYSMTSVAVKGKGALTLRYSSDQRAFEAACVCELLGIFGPNGEHLV